MQSRIKGSLFSMGKKVGYINFIHERVIKRTFNRRRGKEDEARKFQVQAENKRALIH